MTDRTEEFRDRFFALLREYNVEMTVVHGRGWDAGCVGVNFYGYDNETLDEVDLDVGTWENGK